MAIIQGQARVGKTFFITEICTAMLRADPTKKILVVTPLNKPCNIVACKISEQLQEYPKTQGLLIVCAYNVPTKCKYIIAYAKDKITYARKEANKKKTLAKQDQDKKRQLAIKKKKAKDAKQELQEKIQMLEECKKNLPTP